MRLQKDAVTKRVSCPRELEINFDSRKTIAILSGYALRAQTRGIPKTEAAPMELADTRNQAVHVYQEELAEEIYRKLAKALGFFQQLPSQLREP
jgi:hypothetical protein